MVGATSKAARREAVLARVQEVLLALAEDLADAAVAAADEDKKARLATACHKITRGLRQTVYLEARLEREEAELARAGEDRVRKQAEGEALRRKTQAQARVERLVWNEYDENDAEEAREGDDLIARAEAWLDEARSGDGFAEAPLEAVVAALCAHLGLDPDDLACAPAPVLAARPNGCAPAVPNSS